MAAVALLLSQAPRHCLTLRSYSSQKLFVPWYQRSLCPSLQSLPPQPNPTPNEENIVMRRTFMVNESMVEQKQNSQGQKAVHGLKEATHLVKSSRVGIIDEGTSAFEARAAGDDLIKGLKNSFSDTTNQGKLTSITNKAYTTRVAASGMWNGLARGLHGTCSLCITPLSVHHYSSSSRSKVAYSGSEILNYMGGLDDEQKQLIHKLVNFRMKKGKKTRVRAILHETLHRLTRTDRDGVKLVADALENVKPICEVARVKIAGSIYDVPGVVARDRQQTLAVRWILDAAFKRRTNHSSKLEECLFSEIMDAYRKRGTARKKREVLHGLASSNRSYAHFRWW